MKTGAHQNENSESLEIENAKKAAGTKITQWWQKVRSSGKKIIINDKNVHFIKEFRIFLNKKSIPKYFTYFQEKALLQEIQNKPWQSEKFKNPKPNFHNLLINLYAAEKITWEQKATLSDIIASARVYGHFIPYPILTPEGEFTPAAETHLLPFLKKSYLPEDELKFSKEELARFRESIQKLPRSERFFFYFPQQKFDNQGSSPSPHSGLRNDFIPMCATNGFPVIRAAQAQVKLNPLNNDKYVQRYIENPKKVDELVKSLSTATHPMSLQYHGIVKLSFGAENALGIIEYGPQNWWEMIPRLGNQTIDDIEELSKDHLRPTLSPESVQLGFAKEHERVHSAPHEYPEIVAHDDYHRKVIALIGNDIHQAVERIITIARQTFGYQWSKDIWLLRDFDLTSSSLKARQILAKAALSKQRYTTCMFVNALVTIYIFSQLENCDEELQKKLAGRPIMTKPDSINQIALAFVIDLVRNPHIWEGFNILNDEREYTGSPYQLLIRIAKFLNKNGAFSDDMKANVIKFDCFQGCVLDPAGLKALETPEAEGLANTNASLASALAKVQAINEAEIEKYQPKRDNRQVFLGFKKVSEANQPSLPTPPLPIPKTKPVNGLKSTLTHVVSYFKKCANSFLDCFSDKKNREINKEAPAANGLAAQLNQRLEEPSAPLSESGSHRSKPLSFAERNGNLELRTKGLFECSAPMLSKVRASK